MRELVVAAQRGDPGAVRALVDALMPRLGPVCGAIALHDGDDALQEALISVVRNLAALREPAAVVAWSRRIAVREAVRAARRRSLAVIVDDLDDGRGSAEALAEVDVDLGLDVRATLAGLEPEHRAVLVLRHVEGLSEEETAAVLGVAPGTVKSRAHRARLVFRRRWHQ